MSILKTAILIFVFAGCQKSANESPPKLDQVACTEMPPISNGKWNENPPILSGSKITSTCEHGYFANPAPEALCSNGLWTNSFGACSVQTQTHTQTHIETEIHTEIQTHTQTQTSTHTQTQTQTQTQTKTQTQTQTQTETKTHTQTQTVTHTQTQTGVSNLKFAIVTHYTENIESYAEPAIRNQESYAGIFAYKHIARKGVISNEFSDSTKTNEVRKHGLYWQKIAALDELLSKHSSEFDWIFWIDSDAIITNFDRDLASIVEAYGKDKDLIVPLDAGNRAIHINNGVFLIRNSDWSRKFINTVAYMYPFYKDDGTPEQDAMRDLMYSNENGHNLIVRNSDGTHLQRSGGDERLANLLQHSVVRHRGGGNYRESLLNSHVAVIKQHTMDSFYRNNRDDEYNDAQWKEEDFVMHVSELPTSKRAQILVSHSDRLAEQNAIDKSLEEQFSTCRVESFSHQNIEKILKRSFYALHITIKNSVISASNIYHIPNEEIPKARAAIDLLERAKKRFRRMPDVEFVINILDEHQVPWSEDCEPLFSFGTEKGKFRDLLFPFPFTYLDLEEKINMMQRHHQIWYRKKEQLVWRGTQTFGTFTLQNWRQKPRSRLVLWCKAHREDCDAGFSGFSRQVTEDAQNDILREGNLIKGRIEEYEMQNYMYIASLDGNAWADRFARLLASDSLVLKQETDEIEYWYTILKPYVHYLPLNWDISNIETQLKWAKGHPSEVQMIIKNANRIVSDHLSDAKVDRYILRALTTLSVYQNKENPNPFIVRRALVGKISDNIP